MELYPGVYRIQSRFGDRNLFQHLLVGENVVLVDTGVAATPEKAIFPYLDSLKLKPACLTLAITTHPNTDHQEGARGCGVESCAVATCLSEDVRSPPPWLRRGLGAG